MSSFTVIGLLSARGKIIVKQVYNGSPHLQISTIELSGAVSVEAISEWGRFDQAHTVYTTIHRSIVYFRYFRT